MLQRYLLLWLTLSSGVAYLWPQLFPTQAFDPFEASAGHLKLIIGVTMFTVGTLLPHNEIRQVIQKWPTVLAGTAVQYTAMPLLAVGFAALCGLEGDLRIGVIMIGCVPGAMASNVLTLAARGNVSYSVSLTTSATLLSPFVVPLVMWWALGSQSGTNSAGDLLEKGLDLLQTVVGPVLAGHLGARSWSRFAQTMQFAGPVIANLAILWIIAVVVALNRDRLSAPSSAMLVALLAINLGGFASGWTAGSLMRLPTGMRRALTLEVGMQNAGLGTTLVIAWFPDQQAAAIPTALYTFGCMLTGTMLAQWWSNAKLSADDPEQLSRQS